MLAGRQIHEVREDRATLHVPEELISESVAFMRAFDETGDVGDHERLIVVARNHAEIRDERREGIIRDLRFGRADDGDERRFAGVRETNDPNVSDQLELDEQLTLFPILARLREPWGLPRGSGEVLIALPASAAFRDGDLLPVLSQVGDHVAGDLVTDDRPYRQLDRDVGAGVAGHPRAHTVLAAPRFPLALELEVVKRVEAPGRDDEHGSAAAAVSTGWAASGDELFAPERDASGPAVSGLDLDGGLVDEHHLSSSW